MCLGGVGQMWRWKKIFADNGMLLEGQAVFFPPTVDVDYEETLDMTILLQENWSIELSS